MLQAAQVMPYLEPPNDQYWAKTISERVSYVHGLHYKRNLKVFHHTTLENVYFNFK